ncbi:WD40-repeat-containing domain protein [Cantharellus anzutake]|uniref:WD40-repeat-containing domain protein n=1 Tax=Cantharellus anzutake TaxID=1750568 RepID=UPI001908B22F|nr:WD40-repeat-containing domain protein [Cantharellus anzutake]KAF8339876.1 WD40-repeat-containing domain protein [Cantharellus anzutake]
MTTTPKGVQYLPSLSVDDLNTGIRMTLEPPPLPANLPSSSIVSEHLNVPPPRTRERWDTIESMVRWDNVPAQNTQELVQEEQERFDRFKRNMQNLDETLGQIINIAQELTSSVRFSSAAVRLQTRLRTVLDIVQAMRPRLSVQRPRQGPSSHHSTKPRRARTFPLYAPLRGNTRDRTRYPGMEGAVGEAFPDELVFLAKDLYELRTALKSLRGFAKVPDYTSDNLDQSFEAFRGDLEYWANNLSDFRGTFHTYSIRRYIVDLADKMIPHLEGIVDNLRVFNTVGVPTIKFSQKHTAEALQNVSTIATFFSAVSATTIQFRCMVFKGTSQVISIHFLFSYSNSATKTSAVVNLFWLLSLVWSMSSAVNSQLGYRWTLAAYSSPPSAVPWWISIWITTTPLVFLILSILSFTFGLICFTFSNFPHARFIPICVTSSAAISVIALLIVGLWFAGDFYAFRQNKGSRWLVEELEDIFQSFSQWLTRRSTPVAVLPTSSSGLTASRQVQQTDHGEATSPTSRAEEEKAAPSETLASNIVIDGVASNILSSGRESGAVPQVRGQVARGSAAVHPGSLGFEETRHIRSPTLRLSEVVNKVLTHPLRTDNSLARSLQPWHSSALTPGPIELRRRHDPYRSDASVLIHAPELSPAKSKFQRIVQKVIQQNREEIRGQRLSLESSLKSLHMLWKKKVHKVPVKDIQFSPDGQFLATCAWDQTTKIWKLDPSLQLHHTCHLGTQLASQLAWSPDGKFLMAKMTRRGYMIWAVSTGDVLQQFVLPQPRSVQLCVVWMPNGTHVLRIEDANLYQVDIMNGSTNAVFNFSNKEIHDAVVTPDGERMLAVGSLTKSADGLYPSYKSQPEQRIIMFDLTRRTILHQIPILNSIRGLTLSASGTMLLLTHNNETALQLCGIHPAFLTLLHQYPLRDAKCAGVGQMGAPGSPFKTDTSRIEDQIVVSATEEGYFSIWARESAKLLTSFSADMSQGSVLTSVAWNRGSLTNSMVAGGSSDGTVMIWSSTID